MTSPSIVRRATPQDRESVWDLFRLMHAENAIFTLAEQKVNWILDRVLHPESILEGDTGPRGFLGVIGAINKLEGMILLLLCPASWYSDDIIFQDCANFVHPAHRRSTHAKALLSYGRHISDSVGVPFLAGIVTSVELERKVKLYRRQMSEVGAFFLHNGRST